MSWPLQLVAFAAWTVWVFWLGWGMAKADVEAHDRIHELAPCANCHHSRQVHDDGHACRRCWCPSFRPVTTRGRL